MFSFPRAVITRYHKLGGLEQQKFILALPRVQKTEIHVLWLKWLPQEISYPPECSGKQSPPWSPAASGGPSIPWLWPTSLTSLSLCQISLAFSSYKDIYD